MEEAPDILYKFTFGGAFYSHSAVSWSEDNKIAICSDQGIHILMSHCSPLDTASPFTLHKQFIPNPQKTQKFDIPVDRIGLHMHLQKDNLHALMMDHTLSPKLAGAPIFHSFKSALWSPMGAAGFRQCLLASMTFDHRVMLHEEVNGRWSTLADLSDIYLEYCKAEINDNELPKILSSQEAQVSFDNFKEKTYKMAAIAMVWTHIFDMDITYLGRWCYLIMATKSGNLVLWRVIWARECRVEVAGEWKGNLISPKSVCWQITGRSSGFLVIGCQSGIVVLLCITESPNETRKVCPNISDMLYLWKDKDRVIPTCIAVLKQSKTNYIVVFTKGRFLGTCEIVIANLELKVQKVSCVAGLHTLPATGLTVVDKAVPQRTFLVTSMDGRTVKVTINPSERSILLIQEEINLTNNDPKYSPQGITTSPNHMMHAIVYSTAPLIDHLVRREPLQMLLFSINSLTEVVDVLKSHLSDLVLVPLCSTFADIMDYLKARASSSNQVPEFFTEIINSDWQSHSIGTLQLIRFLLKATLAGSLTIGEEVPDQTDKLTNVETLIMKKHYMNLCSLAMNRLDKLTKLQKVSFSLMSDWLEKIFKVSVTEFELDDLTETIREKCRVCKEAIGLTQIFQGACTKGHIFARCCHSLLICDSGAYLRCISCHSLALKDNIWNLKPYCTLCGMLMV